MKVITLPSSEVVISDASSPTYSKDSFFLTSVLNIRFRTRSSAAEAAAFEVSVSRLEKLSERPTVTNSDRFRLHEIEHNSAASKMKNRDFFKTTGPPGSNIQTSVKLGNFIDELADPLRITIKGRFEMRFCAFDAGERNINSSFRYSAAFHCRKDRGISFAYRINTGTDRNHVLAGFDREDARLADAVIIHDSAHFKVVGQDQPFISEFFS